MPHRLSMKHFFVISMLVCQISMITMVVPFLPLLLRLLLLYLLSSPPPLHPSAPPPTPPPPALPPTAAFSSLPACCWRCRRLTTNLALGVRGPPAVCEEPISSTQHTHTNTHIHTSTQTGMGAHTRAQGDAWAQMKCLFKLSVLFTLQRFIWGRATFEGISLLEYAMLPPDMSSQPNGTVPFQKLFHRIPHMQLSFRI